MERNFKGIWIPSEIWLTKELTIAEKLLLVEVDSLSSAKYGCIASNDYLAEFFSLSKDRISKLLTSLEKKGFIERKMIYKANSKEIDKRVITTLGYRKKCLEIYTQQESENITDENIGTKIIETMEEKASELVDEIMKKDPIGKNTYTPIGENDQTPIGENAKDINTTIINTTTTINTGAVVVDNYEKKDTVEKWLKKYVDLPTYQNIVNLNLNISEKEFVEIFEKCKLEKKQGYCDNINAVLVLALQNKWSFRAKEIDTTTPSQKTLDYLKKEREENEKEVKEKEKLDEYFETLSEEDKKDILDFATAKSINENPKQPKVVQEIMARNIYKYHGIKSHMELKK